MKRVKKRFGHLLISICVRSLMVLIEVVIDCKGDISVELITNALTKSPFLLIGG